MNDLKRIIIVVLALICLGVCAFGVKGHLDSDGYKRQVSYATAIQSTKADDFNYIVDSQQGRVLSHGTFTAKPNLAKFDEMSQGFSYVKRTKEHYTPHQSCSKRGCSTYYTWDETDSEVRYADRISYMERAYPTTLFNFDKLAKKTDACAFTRADTSNNLIDALTKDGCYSEDYYIDNDDRYVYETTPVTFDATFLATTYGSLSAYNEPSITLENKSIDQVLVDVGKYKLYSFWVLVFILIGLTIGATYLAYKWVYLDGEWSLYR